MAEPRAGPLTRRGTIQWRGDIGSSAKDNVSRSDVGEGVNATTLINLCAAVEPYSTCNLNYYYWILSYNQTLGAPGTGSNIDRKAVLYFRHPDTLAVLNFQYPDPTADSIETTAWGKQIKSVVVAEVVALLSTYAGVSYIPLYGVYYQRK